MASQTSSTAANGKSAVIESGHGGDLLAGGAGAGVFHIASVEASAKADQDTIEGFGAGDLIGFSGIALQGADAPATLHWAGVEPDSGKAYGVWQWADGTLRADVNGDSTADISLNLQGKLLSAADFDFGQDAHTPTQPGPMANVIESGHGGDLLVGEAGADVFHIASVEASAKADQDTIEGFGAGDLISFSGIALQGADAPTTLHWAGVEPDSGKAYGVWQWADGTLRPDINGDSTADISLNLQGKLLSAADFDFGQDSFGPTQPQQPEQPSDSGGDLSIGTTVWAETFDNGTGILSRIWGAG